MTPADDSIVTRNAAVYAYMDALLLALPPEFEGAIAGGSLRDVFNDREVKDIDLFVRASGEDRARLLGIMDGRFKSWRPLFANGDYVGVLERGIERVYQCEPLREDIPPVQIIVVVEGRTPLSVCAENDFGLCRSYMRYSHKDAALEVGMPLEYHRDCDAKTMTLLTCFGPEDLVRSLRRYRRLVQKYVGFTLLIPSGVRPYIEMLAAPEDRELALAGYANWRAQRRVLRP